MKVLLVDDHRMMRDGLRTLLESAGMTVTGEAASGLASVALARCVHPDVVVIDIAMPGMNGIETARQLAREQAEMKIVALSMHADPRYVKAMFEAGAHGYLLKHAASEELVQAIRTVVNDHRSYLSPAVAGLMVDVATGRVDRMTSGAAALTPREREVLKLVAEGHSSKEIGSHLSVAMTTVESHRRQIMDKLGLHSVATLTKYAIREGITSLE